MVTDTEGLTTAVFEKRIGRLQRIMHERGLDVVIATSLPSMAYIAGIYQSLAWYVNTAVVVPRSAEPAMFVPLADMERVTSETWITDVRPWNPTLGSQPARPFEAGIAQFIRDACGGGNLRAGVEANLSWQSHLRLGEQLDQVEWVDGGAALQQQMLVKDPEELRFVRKAAELCRIGYEAARDSVRVGLSESQLLGAVEQAMREHDCDGYWVPNQAGTGRAVMLDHYPSDRRIEQGDIVKVGIHPSYKNYRGDICATMSFDAPTGAFKDLCDYTAEATEQLIEAIRPGVRSSELDAIFRGRMESAGYGDRCRWYLGHGLGTGHLPPMIAPDDHTELVENMLLVVNTMAVKEGEPGLVLETMTLVTGDGVERLVGNPMELVVV